MEDGLCINPKNLGPRDTDKVYSVSYDAGDLECRCSRCDRQIEEDNGWVRIFLDRGYKGEIVFCDICLAA